MATSLIERLETVTATSLSIATDLHKLSGFFNRYRPDGRGLERLFENSGVEGEIFLRIRKVFSASAACWRPDDLYFTIREHEPVDRQLAATIANRFLMDFRKFAEHIGDSDVAEALEGIQVQSAVPSGAEPDLDPPAMMYECLTDFLATHQPAQNELFVLKEPLYSIANDYFLMAYMMWPAFAFSGELAHALDRYFDVWRLGISINFFKRGIATAVCPAG